MKGMIDKRGVLHIERCGEMVKCECCDKSVTSNDDIIEVCSHYCVAFMEPRDEMVIDHVYGPASEPKPTGRMILQLCRNVGTLIFEELEDKRTIHKEG